MHYSIDEIYHLFMWDPELSDEENEAKAQTGMDAARQMQNLFPFMQPIVVPPEKSKSVWEPCAKVIAMRSDEELKPFLYLLLEWLQDLNWPGASTIYDRLTRIPFSQIEFNLKLARTKAVQTKDLSWRNTLDDLSADIQKNKKECDHRGCMERNN